MVENGRVLRGVCPQFQDSNGDGVGDLNGISQGSTTLRTSGIDAIWVTPFYPSPQVDFGYDITDHEAVDPLFGTLDDFDRLVAAAHRRGIRVVIDVVLNHTSNLHRFFVASRAARGSEYRDWYVWRDGRSRGEPPNNSQSAFGGPAWTYDEGTEQWYYHCFYPEQPDLNWRNPASRNAADGRGAAPAGTTNRGRAGSRSAPAARRETGWAACWIGWRSGMVLGKPQGEGTRRKASHCTRAVWRRFSNAMFRFRRASANSGRTASACWK